MHGRIEDLAESEDDGALDEVFQFARVARPIVNTVLSLILASKASEGLPRFSNYILPALLSLAAEPVTFKMLGITALSLMGVIAAWAILIDIMEIAAAVRLRKEI